MVDAIEEGERWYSLIDMLQKDIKDFKSNIIPCNDSSYSVWGDQNVNRDEVSAV